MTRVELHDMDGPCPCVTGTTVKETTVTDMERIATALEAIVKQNEEALGLARENVRVNYSVEEYWRRRDKRDERDDIDRATRAATEQRTFIEFLRSTGYTVERKSDD